MATVIKNGSSGYVHTDIRQLILRMQALLDDPAEAKRLGNNARRYAQTRFNMHRFIQDWNCVFAWVTGQGASLSASRESSLPAARPASLQRTLSVVSQAREVGMRYDSLSSTNLNLRDIPL